MTKNTPLLLSGFLDGSSFHGMSSPEKRNEKKNIGTISEGSSRDQTSCIHLRLHFSANESLERSGRTGQLESAKPKG